MPVIILEGIKLNSEDRSKLVSELTMKTSKIMNIPEQAFVVVVKDNEAENIEIGGDLLSK